jgi:uncharacterized membrane protein
MTYPGYSILALALVVVLALLAVGASVAVWRIRSMTAASRYGLMGLIAVFATAGITWIVFVSPVYVD